MKFSNWFYVRCFWLRVLLLPIFHIHNVLDEFNLLKRIFLSVEYFFVLLTSASHTSRQLPTVKNLQFLVSNILGSRWKYSLQQNLLTFLNSNSENNQPTTIVQIMHSPIIGHIVSHCRLIFTNDLNHLHYLSFFLLQIFVKALLFSIPFRCTAYKRYGMCNQR